MPIKKYIPGTTFGPETIKDMTTAFRRIRIILKLKDPEDPLIEVIAKKVISLASQGTIGTIVLPKSLNWKRREVCHVQKGNWYCRITKRRRNRLATCLAYPRHDR